MKRSVLLVFVLAVIFPMLNPVYARTPPANASSMPQPPGNHKGKNHNPFNWFHRGPGCTKVQHPSRKFGGKPVTTCERAPYSNGKQ
jgi:hypothetical protein